MKAIDYKGRQERELCLCGGNANNGAKCGLGYVNSNNAFSNANANVGSRLTFPIVMDKYHPEFLEPWHVTRARTHTRKGHMVTSGMSSVAKVPGEEEKQALPCFSPYGKNGIENETLDENGNMARHKERHLYARMLMRENVEKAADDAYRALKTRTRKRSFAVRFDNDRGGHIDKVMEMLKARVFPMKEYHEEDRYLNGKTRRLSTLPFFPWSVLTHLIKNMIEPIVANAAPYELSGGIKGKGTVFSALRARNAMRRYRHLTYYAQADMRKFFQAMPHRVILDTLRHYIDDEDFIGIFDTVILDYKSDVFGLLWEEVEKRNAHCGYWASEINNLRDFGDRGVTIGGCASAQICLLVLSIPFREMKEVEKVPVMASFCDDVVMFARSKEEAFRYLMAWDRKMARIGHVLKHSSFVAPVCDEDLGIGGRKVDFSGFVSSRRRMMMRKSVKQNFARRMKTVKSRRRASELVAAYNGIAKWGDCKHLYDTVMASSMVHGGKEAA